MNAAPTNEHTRAAVVALAEACRENAIAITRAADALKGTAGMNPSVVVGGL